MDKGGIVSTNLVKAQTRAVASYAGYSPEEVDVIRRTYGAGCTDDELRLFFYVARETNLSPFRKQLYPVKRWDSKQGREVMAIQTGIDGYRAVASRTGLYEGQETFWCGDDGKWVDVWLSEKPPAAARCLVYRKGSLKPIVGVARWTAYAQKKKDGSFTPFWLKMPDLMLAKCAESLALRKAFPEELAGLHTDEEMGQSSDFQARREAQQDIAERKLTEMRKAHADGKGAEYLTAPADAATGEPAPPAAIPDAIEAEFDNPDAEPEPTDEQIHQNNFAAKMKLFALAKQTIGDQAYYRVLGNHGVEHANELRDYKSMDFLLAEMREIAAEQKARKKRK